VKICPPAQSFASCSPSVSITLHQYAGPATFAPEMKPNPVFSGRASTPLKPGVWTKLEAVTPPIAGNVLGVTLGCHLDNDGTAWFDDIAFEKLA